MDVQAEPYPSDDLIVNIDSHDLQRQAPLSSLTYTDGKLYELANIFMLAYPYGQPLLMSSYSFSSFDQGPPSTRVHGESSELRSRSYHATAAMTLIMLACLRFPLCHGLSVYLPTHLLMEAS